MDKPSTSQGNPLDKTEIYETLFVFIDDVLFHYKPSTNKKGEDDITQDIETFMNNEAHSTDTSFAFQNQYKEGLFTADIGVYLRSNNFRFCWIEAKRLPTPNEKDRDEREYVIVSEEKKANGIKKFKGNGGIQRFKEGKHAPNRPYSIMIGYIQDNNSVDYWLPKINRWITELVDADNGLWTYEDCLNKYTPNKCDRFLSVHKRKDESKITLHHYWINL